MYLHNSFIAAIRSIYRHAHSGNVNQLLEALNKLAKFGELELKEDYVNNRFSCWYHEGGTSAKTAILTSGDDTACMNLCKWAGSLLQALRSRGELV